MNPQEREWRFTHLRQLGCVACCFRYDAGLPIPRSPPEVHHLNLGGLAGQKRRGDEFTICLCSYHHRSAQQDGYTASEMYRYYGPSLAGQSKEFRRTYGSDNELLRLTNGQLRRLEHNSVLAQA
jgi:hypothetical protein